ncbi:arylsulfatase B-like [Palaemon carinicauda]|uniref:arylsulfatase B-like n=1 Tax=Palaemon carinicauda TaxID=392227 RepID=UPI0035B64F93
MRFPMLSHSSSLLNGLKTDLGQPSRYYTQQQYERDHHRQTVLVMKTKGAILLLALIGIITILPSLARDVETKPHIILIVADDLGWNDVSWHNPKAMTPHLEELAKGGVVLNQAYVQPICTPTRSALLTGRYPYTLGRQRGVLWPEEPTGLTIKHKIIPQALKAVGYSTHIVGKWHLGFCSWDYTPTSRGFDTFWGYYTGAEDYYHHVRPSWYQGKPVHPDQPLGSRSNSIPFGYDFRNNTDPEYSVDGQYSTYVFSSYIEDLLRTRNASDPMFLYLPFQSVHSPLQVPKNYTAPFEHIKDQARRVKLGMILALDEAVGRVLQSLKDTGHYDNSVIIFTSDNGGPTVSAGNNWPLRGNKTTLWEGGTRVPAFVHSPLLPNKGTVSNKLIHVTDWFATSVGLGGGTFPDDTNGYDQWKAISSSAPSPRAEMIYNIDMTNGMDAGIRMGDYKLLVGNPGPGKWTPPPEGKSIDSFQQEVKMNLHDSWNSINKFTEPQLLEEHPTRLDVATTGVSLEESALSFERIHHSWKSIYEFTESQLLEEHPTRLDVPTTGVPFDESTLSLETTEDLEHGGDVATTRTRNENEEVTLEDLGIQLDHFPILKQFMSSSTKIQVYNVTGDPEERKNIAPTAKNVVKTLLGLLQYYLKDYVNPDILPDNPAANPAHWNNTWTPGWCKAK